MCPEVCLVTAHLGECSIKFLSDGLKLILFVDELIFKAIHLKQTISWSNYHYWDFIDSYLLLELDNRSLGKLGSGL